MTNFRLLCLIAALMAATFLATGSARAELLAYFPFDGNTNEVENNLPVTVNGGGLTYVSDAPFGQGAKFDGVDDYLDVADGPDDVLESLDGPIADCEGTIMLWVRTTAPNGGDGSTGPTFVERRQPGTFKVLYKLNLGADGDLVNLSYPPSKYAVSNTTINDGTWHHIAANVKRSADGTYSICYVFVDGYQKGLVVLDESYDFTLCEDLHIGGREKNDGSATSFIATDMDELAVYDEWLSGAEIREIMAYGVIPEPCTAVLLGLGLLVVLLMRKR